MVPGAVRGMGSLTDEGRLVASLRSLPTGGLGQHRSLAAGLGSIASLAAGLAVERKYAAPSSETPENCAGAAVGRRCAKLLSFATFAKHWEQAVTEAVRYQSAKQDGSNVTLDPTSRWLHRR